MKVPVARPPIVLAGLLLVVSTPAPALAQENEAYCCTEFDYVLERTIFKIDAVRLELTVRDETPRRVAAFVREHPDPRSAGESIAAMYLAAEDADVRFTFLRSFSLNRFLDANRDVMQRLTKAGLLTDEEFRKLDAENFDRFAVLAGEGIRDGDRLEHEVRGDTVTTRYTDVTGTVRVDEVRIGSEQRRVLLGSLFGPHSGFRNGLLGQVFSGPYSVR